MKFARKSNIFFSIVLLICGFFNPATGFCETDITTPTEISVQDIDLGDYQTEMYLYRTQLIVPTLLPTDATERDINYQSSDESIASVNVTGKITAVNIGVVEIIISAGGLTRSFTLSVLEEPKVTEPTTIPVSEIAVQDIDLGDYQTEMYLYDTQLIVPTLLPTDATEQDITYQSSDESIASVNMMGRITAINIGAVKISVSAGGVMRSFTLSVLEEPKATEPNEIPVSDIELSSFKDTIKIDEVVDVTATVLPRDATEQMVVFSSSNHSVAKVSSSGKITGIGAGEANIIMEAGGFRKTVSLTVKIPTEGINVNDDYIILEKGDIFEMTVNVSPTNADQKVTYKSIFPDVASISDTGQITAVQSGSTSIIISTWDTSIVISVIVTVPKSNNCTDEDQIEAIMPTNDEPNNNLNNRIQTAEDGETISVMGNTIPIVTVNMLHSLFGTNKKLEIVFDEYSILIIGSEIKNANNELKTSIIMNHNSKGTEVLLNNGEKIPGKIHLQLFNERTYNYLYLYNELKQNYQEINSLSSNNCFFLDCNGKYLLAESALSNPWFNWELLIVASIIFITLGIAYIVVKKKHWFW